MKFIDNLATASLLPFRRHDACLTKRPRRAVYALGGGGARGLAHLGAIERVGEAGIQTERFVGVSIGALVGAMVAIGNDVRDVQARAVEFLTSSTFLDRQQVLFGSASGACQDPSLGIMAWYERVKYFYSAHRRLTRAATKSSLLDPCVLMESIDDLIPDIDFAELAVPLSVVAADLRSGHRVVIETGSVRTAVHASMSLPGIFPPVEYRGMLLCDIGVVDALPSVVAKAYASDLTIGVDVTARLERIESSSTAIDVMMRMQDIGGQMMNREKAGGCDVLVRPELSDIAWFDFRDPGQVIDRGREAAGQSLAAASGISYEPMQSPIRTSV